MAMQAGNGNQASAHSIHGSVARSNSSAQVLGQKIGSIVEAMTILAGAGVPQHALDKIRLIVATEAAVSADLNAAFTLPANSPVALVTTTGPPTAHLPSMATGAQLISRHPLIPSGMGESLMHPFNASSLSASLAAAQTPAHPPAQSTFIYPTQTSHIPQAAPLPRPPYSAYPITPLAPSSSVPASTGVPGFEASNAYNIAISVPSRPIKPAGSKGQQLCEKEAIEIYLLRNHAACESDRLLVAKRYGVSSKTVLDVMRGRTWIYATRHLWSPEEVAAREARAKSKSEKNVAYRASREVWAKVKEENEKGNEKHFKVDAAAEAAAKAAEAAEETSSSSDGGKETSSSDGSSFYGVKETSASDSDGAKEIKTE